MAISAERLNLFRPASFASHKAAHSFRVFALGGSTTQGEPYSTETAFPQWLQLNLQAALDGRQVEVINCGGLSYASYRVLAILREVLNYSPDLIVIYTGHNEYLEHRTYADYLPASALNRTVSWLSRLHTVQLARVLAGQSASRPTSPQADARTGTAQAALQREVDALLDYQGGLADYRRDDAWMEPIPEHFRWNVKQMCDECRDREVPLILVRPVSNVLDCPPFKIENAPGLSPAETAQFERHWQAARAALSPRSSPNQVPEASGPLFDEGKSRERALFELNQALRIDPGHAGAHYLLGQLQWDSGDFQLAGVNLRSARDHDVCPLRATSEIASAISEIAHREHVPLLDAELLFSERSEHELVGQRWLVDHVHPNLEGHQLLGYELARLCFELELLPAPPHDWDSRRLALIRAHISGLNEDYFFRGQQRLAGLQLWTQGRAKKVRSELAPSPAGL